VEAMPAASLSHPNEQRASPRFTLLIQTAKLIATGGEYLCIVRDASADGIRVRHFGYMPMDKFVGFELANGESFTAEIVWQDEKFAGLKFRQEVDLDRVVRLSSNGLPKRQLRLEIELEGMATFAGIRSPVRIRNLSQQGACVQCAEHMAVGQLLKVETGDLEPTFARVRWRRVPLYGLVFEDTLSLERLATIVAQSHARQAGAGNPPVSR